MSHKRIVLWDAVLRVESCVHYTCYILLSLRIVLSMPFCYNDCKTCVVSQSALDCSKASRSVGLRSRSEPETVDRVLLNADQVKVSKIYTNIALLLKGSFTQTSC